MKRSVGMDQGLKDCIRTSLTKGGVDDETPLFLSCLTQI